MSVRARSRYLKERARLCLLACLLLTAAEAAEPSQSAEDTIRRLGAEILARHGISAPVPFEDTQPRTASLPTRELARRRADALVDLIRTDPGRAVSLAFPQEALQELRARSPDLSPDLEKRGSWQGEATLFIADDFENHRSWEYHSVRTSEGYLDAYGIPSGAWSRNGDLVEVAGISVRGQMAVLEARRQEVPDPGLYPAATTCESVGKQKLAVFLVYRKEQEMPTFDASAIRELVFGTRRSLDRYVRTVSFGRAWLSGDVFGPIAVDAKNDEDIMWRFSEEIAREAGIVDLTQYGRVVQLGPGMIIDFGGRSSVGCSGRNYSLFAANTGEECIDGSCRQMPSLETLIHELGHSLGLRHSTSLTADGESLGLEVSTMAIKEYDDVFDPMGSGPEGSFFNARHLRGIGWLDSDNILTVENEGTFKIRNLIDTSSLHDPIALRIRRQPNIDQWIWVESAADTRDSMLARFRFQTRQYRFEEKYGAVIRLEDNSLPIQGGNGEFSKYKTYLLDMTPSVAGFKLPLGITWEDTYSPLSITVDPADGNDLSVRVERQEREASCAGFDEGPRTFTPSSQEGVIDVKAPLNCSWKIRVLADWLEVDASDLAGIGPAQIHFRIPEHTGTFNRQGHVAIGLKSVELIQKARSAPPAIEALHPKSGAGKSGAFRIEVSDPNADVEGIERELESIRLLFRSGRDELCSAIYEFGRRFRLVKPRSSVNDQLDNQIIDDQACTVDFSRSSMSVRGGRAVVVFRVIFSESLPDVLNFEAVASDRDGNASVESGSWMTDEATSGRPKITGVSGFIRPGSPARVRLDATDPDGAFDIASIAIAIRSKTGPEWCSVALDTANRRVVLTGYGQPWQQADAPHTEGPLENEYCTVVPSSMSTLLAYDDASTLRVRVPNVHFSRLFAAPKSVEATVTDRSGHRAERVAEHDLPETVDNGSPGPLPGTVSPNSGAGREQRFEWTYENPDGDGRSTGGRLTFVSSDRSAACLISLSNMSVDLGWFRRQPWADGWSERGLIGSLGVLENDYCSVDLASMKYTVSDYRQTISALVKFKPKLGDLLTLTLSSDSTDQVVRGFWSMRESDNEPFIAAVVDAASLRDVYYRYPAVEPLQALRVYGGNLGPVQTVQALPADPLSLDSGLGGTRMLQWYDRDGEATYETLLPVLMAAGELVETALPHDNAPGNRVAVERGGARSDPFEIRPFAIGSSSGPSLGVFTRDGTGVGQVLAENADGSPNGPESPAPSGAIVTLYATGTGWTGPTGDAGGATSPTAPVSVVIGNRASEVLSANSEIPGELPGRTRIRVRLNDETPGGPRIPVSIVVGGETSQPGITMAVDATGGAGCATSRGVPPPVSPSLQHGILQLEASADCSWKVRSLSDWIELDRPSISGTGPAEVRYKVSEHAGSSDRRGHILVGQDLVAVVQQARPVPPVIESLHPKVGSGRSSSFRVEVSDANAGANVEEELREVSLSFRSGRELVCSVEYSFRNKEFHLDVSTPASRDRRTANEVCDLDLTRSSMRAARDRVVVVFHINFNESLPNVLHVHARAYDREWNTAVESGSWSTEEATSGRPKITGVSGSIRPGSPAQVRLDATDPDGAFDIASIAIAIRSKTGPEWCSVALDTANRKVVLTGYGQPRQQADAPHTEGPLENEYCTVVPSAVSTRAAYDDASTLSVRVPNVHFSRLFAAQKSVEATVTDRSGHRAERVAEHDLPETVDNGSPGPLPGTVSPNSGAGREQRFEWTYENPDGDGRSTGGRLTFVSSDRSAACQIYLSNMSVALGWFRRQPWGSGRSEWERIGSLGVLENDYCSVDLASMKYTVSDYRQTISALVKFKPKLGDLLTLTLSSDSTDQVVRGFWSMRESDNEPFIAAVVDAASLRYVYYEYPFVAPLQALRVVGGNLGPVLPVRALPADSLSLDSGLTGTRVLRWYDRDGQAPEESPIPVLMVANGLVEAAFPHVKGNWNRLAVERNGVRSDPFEVRSSSGPSPSVFTRDGTGVGQVLAENADGSPNGPENPARSGASLTLYATGTGWTSPTSNASGATRPLAPVSVVIGNRASELVSVNSEIPTELPGRTRIRVRLSDDTPSGPRIPVSVVVGGNTSQPGITIAVTEERRD